jgi:3-deoxy-D-manno-octulosonate 8-phosphate phosphatase (KDO 8-P phosphatase)
VVPGAREGYGAIVIDAKLARRLRLVGFDVDGVLTDGGVYLGSAGDRPVELKRFHIQDGLAVLLLRAAGIAVVLVSGRASEATAIRAREIGVDDLVQDDAARKLPAFEELLRRRQLRFDECAFAGDDIADLPLLTRVALPIAVANAVAEVKAVAGFVTGAEGGHGAVREIAEAILKARGVWDSLLQQYLLERGDAAQRAAGSR